MMYNLNKICSQENIETIEDEEFALEGYTLEIIRILKKGQQDKVNRKNTREETSTGEGKGQETRREENLEEEEELRGQEIEQDLGKREKEMDEKITENQAKLAKKRKEREEEEEEDRHKKKQKSIEVKRTRQQQEQEYPEGQKEESKLRSGKIRKINPVERSLRGQSWHIN